MRTALADARRTGTRAKGTRLHELRDLFETGITARAIYEDLECRRPEEPAEKVADYMAEQAFDVMGVETENAVGYVSREDLTEGTCGDHLFEFTPDHLVADSTPLITVLSELRDRLHLFVLAEEEVEGIITRADLQKLPVRMYLFSLVTLLEMHIGAIVRSVYENERWTDELSNSRVESAKDFQEKRQERDEELALVDCLQFCDKRDLVIKRQESRNALGVPSRTAGEQFLKDVEDLRNNLAHAQELASNGGWTPVIELVVEIEGMVARSEDFFAQG